MDCNDDGPLRPRRRRHVRINKVALFALIHAAVGTLLSEIAADESDTRVAERLRTIADAISVGAKPNAEVK